MLSRVVPRGAARVVAAAFLALFAAACEHMPSEPGSLASITVTPNPVTMEIGATRQFAASGRDANGSLVGVKPAWSVATGGGAIDATTGVFTAGTVVGTYTNTVVATLGSLSGRATVVVIAGPAASIVITPTPVTLVTGTTQQFTAVAKDAGGNIVSTLPNWAATGGVGTISNTGLLIAGPTAGTYTSSVTASIGAVSASATVTVTAGALASVTVTPNPQTLTPGATQTFAAAGKDANGNAVAITPVWSVVASGGSIVAGTGVFTAGTVPGVYANTVKATAGAISGTATVTVIPGALATITVVRNPDTLAVNAIRQFDATGTDANGNVVVISPVWTVQAGGGTISTTGVFTAGTVTGTFTNTVTATVGAISGRATAVVTAGPAATIVVTPNPVTLAPGATQQFSAAVKDAFGNTVTTAPNWSVATGGGTISSTGLFTAGTVSGVYTNTVTASVGTVAGTATVTVTPAALSTITVTPNPVSMATGATQQFTATGRDANGNIVAITPTWAVVASGGTINASGLFTAGTVAGTYTNTVRACSTAACGSGSTAGFATVTVNAGSLANITVSPTPVNVNTNATQQFTAVGTDANGNVVPIVPTQTWSVKLGGAGGAILSSGGYTAPATVGVGFDTVLATSGAIVGKARVNVLPSTALATITVTPNPAVLLTGGTQQFTATGFDGSGNVVATPGLAWAVVNGGGTITSGGGLFTAGAVSGVFTNTVRATSGTVQGFATVNISSSGGSGPSLGTAETHGIIAGSGISCASAPGTVNADVSISPGTAVSGFPPCVITGATNVANTPAARAQADLLVAYNALQAMPCGTTITSDLGGTTLAAGVYCSTSTVGVTGTVTLTGTANSVFVIRAASALTTAGSVVMAGGAQAKNVFWVAASSATLGVNSGWQGNVVAFTSITLAGNVTMVGRALALNGAVSLNGLGNTITLP